MKSYTTNPKWRWRDTRDIGMGLQFWPFNWRYWGIKRFSSGMGWCMMLMAGPILIEISFNAGDGPPY